MGGCRVRAGAVQSGEMGRDASWLIIYITSVERLLVLLQWVWVVLIGTQCGAHSVRH